MSISSRTEERGSEENVREVLPRVRGEVEEVLPVVRDVTARRILLRRSQLRLPPHDSLYDYPLLLFI
jgi:hypothetical protein